jgi:dermatan 4-sulfotransferase 1
MTQCDGTDLGVPCIPNLLLSDFCEGSSFALFETRRNTMKKPHFIVLHQRCLIYARIPKVANSSIKAALTSFLERSWKPGQKVTSDKFWRTGTLGQSKIVGAKQAMKLRKSHLIFTFVRNPFDRLVSAYNNKLIENSGPIAPSLVSMGLTPGMPFPRFIEQVAATRDDDLDVHLLPQSSILVYNGKVLAHFVGRHESIESDWSALQQVVYQFNKCALPRLPQKNVRRSRGDHLRSYFTSRDLIDVVADRYAGDIRHFYPECTPDELVSNIWPAAKATKPVASVLHPHDRPSRQVAAKSWNPLRRAKQLLQRLRTPHTKASWSVCATVREPLSVLEQFVFYYRKQGAERICLFFDDPHDSAISWAATQHDVTCVVCDTQHRRRLGLIRATHIDLQIANYKYYLDKLCGTDWAISIDADEFLQSPFGIGAFLHKIPRSIDAILVRPVEAISVGHNGPAAFSQNFVRTILDPKQPHDEELRQLVYGRCADMLPRGLMGHSIGKTLLRRNRTFNDIKLHHAHPSRKGAKLYPPTEEIMLIHYDAPDFESFVRKFSHRLSKPLGHMGYGRKKARNILRPLFEKNKKDLLQFAYAALYCLTPQQAALLVSAERGFFIDPATRQRVTSVSVTASHQKRP